MLSLFGYKNHCYADEYAANTVMNDMDLPGNTFSSTPTIVTKAFRDDWNSWDFRYWVLRPVARGCKKACNRNPRCLAWTYKFYGYRKLEQPVHPAFGWDYIRVRGECFLKDSVPSVVPKVMHFSGVMPPRTPRPQPPSTSIVRGGIEYNTDRPGDDYRNIIMKSGDANNCRAICMKDVWCKAWTFVKPNKLQGNKAHCWLKNSVPGRVHNSRCVSGVK